MKKVINILVLIILLISCRSAQELVESAKRKDPNIILCKDSIIEKVIEGEKIVLFGRDSLIIRTPRVFIRATSDSINGLKLEYELIETTVSITETTPVITPKKTRKEVRNEKIKNKQDGKTDRVGLRQDGKTDRKKENTKKEEVKQDGKTDRNNKKQDNKRKGWVNLILVGIAIGAAGMWLIMTKIFRYGKEQTGRYN